MFVYVLSISFAAVVLGQPAYEPSPPGGPPSRSDGRHPGELPPGHPPQQRPDRPGPRTGYPHPHPQARLRRGTRPRQGPSPAFRRRHDCGRIGQLLYTGIM